MAGRLYTNRITMDPAPGFAGSGSEKLDIYAVYDDPNGVVSGSAGDRAFLIGGSSAWVCAGGTVWNLTDTGSGSRATFTYQPGGTDDPDNGVYVDWSEAHTAAAINAENQVVYLIIDDTFDSPAVIDDGDFDMRNILLVGAGAFQTDVPVQVGQPIGSAAVETGDTTFDNFTHISYILLNHTGSAPLFAIPNDQDWAVSIGPVVLMTSTTDPVYYVPPGVDGGGSLTIYIDSDVSFTTGGGGGSFGVDAPSTLSILFTGRVAFGNNTIVGDGDITIATPSPLVSLGSQAGYSGTITIVRPTAADVLYDPADGALWVNPDPSNVADALDRLAAAVEGLLGAPIP